MFKLSGPDSEHRTALSKMLEALLDVTLLVTAIGLLLVPTKFMDWSILWSRWRRKNLNTKSDEVASIFIEINVYGNWIWNFYAPQAHYSVLVKQIGESPMPKPLSRAMPRAGGNGITTGGQGTFQAQLNNNGVPVSLPGGSSWDWTTDDTLATITIDTSDPTGGTVDISIPANDTATQIIVTASTTDPDGNVVTGTLTVPVTPGVSMFTVTVTQIA
jgi:hypothetical protein